MIKKLFKIPVLVTILAIVFVSCSKVDEDLRNPINVETNILFNSGVTYGSMTDQEGNKYKTVTIGSQIWMAENLRTSIYNDGAAIPNVTDNDEWLNLKTDAYCNYKNTSNTDTIATYGRLYNWHAVNTGKLAPIGWHVPSDEEWKQLEIYLGMNQSNADTVGIRGSEEGGLLKETGITHWTYLNIGATNESGFTALPGGGRFLFGLSVDIGDNGYWWSSTDYLSYYAYFRAMVNYDNGISRYYFNKYGGASIRCLRD